MIPKRTQKKDFCEQTGCLSVDTFVHIIFGQFWKRNLESRKDIFHVSCVSCVRAVMWWLRLITKCYYDEILSYYISLLNIIYMVYIYGSLYKKM